MKILHVIPYMDVKAGGPPVVVENLVNHMGPLGCEFRIVFTPLFSNGDADSLVKQVSRLAPAEMLPRGDFGLLCDRRARALVLDMVKLSDIVHVHTLWNPLNRLAFDACLRHRRPYVLMPHGMLDPYSLGVRRWRKRAYMAAVEGDHLRQAHRLIYTTSEEQRLADSQVSKLPGGAVVRLGAEAPTVDPIDMATEFVDAFPIVRDRRQLLFLGRLHEKKGLDRILSALPEIVHVHPDIILTIAGSGSPQFEQTIRSEIERLALGDRVLMAGFLQGTLKWGAYASASLFLLPSRQENFALSVAEAMHAGLPVIVSDKVNTWPLVNDAGAGIVMPESLTGATLASAIIKLLNDRNGMRKMGRRGKEYAEQHLTWRRAAREMLDCYQDVMREAGAVN
jgi:glycosyltransferase involved in cell wall biosynthesis